MLEATAEANNRNAFDMVCVVCYLYSFNLFPGNPEIQDEDGFSCG